MVSILPPDMGFISRLDKSNRTSPNYRLTFGGDTYIAISGLSINIANDHEVRYKIDSTALPTNRQGIWGDVVPETSGPTNGFLIVGDGFPKQYRVIRGSGGVNIDETDIPVVATELWVREDTPGGEGPLVLVGTDGTYADGSFKSTWTGRTGTITNIWIGDTGTWGAGFEGTIWDFEIYNSSNTLIHSWAINDNSTTIVDSVGGQNGTLTIGSGSWNIV